MAGGCRSLVPSKQANKSVKDSESISPTTISARPTGHMLESSDQDLSFATARRNCPNKSVADTCDTLA